ncbi:MAG: alpha-L-fucosidase [Sedimentisphaeraceae bacterium JB056]
MTQKFNDGRDWFFDKKFGLFVHWGLYSLIGWHEQVLQRRNMDRRDYERLIQEFNPKRFNPEEWLDIAQESGMEYIYFTTKHHDGFCLWDTKQTSYNITNTPYKKDVLGILAEACAKRNFPLCLYYSVVDWHHPNYPNQGRHHEMPAPRPTDSPDMEAYVEYVKKQVTELCTNYGSIYGFFWDINVPKHKDKTVNEIIRKLQPNAVINNRGFDEGDFATPERNVPEGSEFTTPTQACQSLGKQSWGYKSGEDYYSHKFIMQSIDKILAMGGTYLLNVGPKSDGTIPNECVESLKIIGQWYKSVKESFNNTKPASHLIDTPNILVTKKERALYLHLFKDSDSSTISLEPMTEAPAKATLLNNETQLEFKIDSMVQEWRTAKPHLRIRKIPINEMQDTVMVIKLEY